MPACGSPDNRRVLYAYRDAEERVADTTRHSTARRREERVTAQPQDEAQKCVRRREPAAQQRERVTPSRLRWPRRGKSEHPGAPGGGRAPWDGLGGGVSPTGQTRRALIWLFSGHVYVCGKKVLCSFQICALYNK